MHNYKQISEIIGHIVHYHYSECTYVNTYVCLVAAKYSVIQVANQLKCQEH